MATLQPALLKIIVLNYKTNNALITDPDIWRLRRSSDKRSLSYACAQTLIRQEPVGIFLFFLFFFIKPMKTGSAGSMSHPTLQVSLDLISHAWEKIKSFLIISSFK